MSFKFTCPHCNQTIECENKFAGMTAPCPRCREIVELKRDTHVPQKPQEPELKHEHEHEQHSEPPKSAPEENRPVQSNGSNGPHKNSAKVECKKQRFLPHAVSDMRSFEFVCSIYRNPIHCQQQPKRNCRNSAVLFRCCACFGRNFCICSSNRFGRCLRYA